MTEDWLRTVRKSAQKETVLAGGNERVGKVGGVGGRYVHDRSFGKSLLYSAVFLTALHKQSLDYILSSAVFKTVHFDSSTVTVSNGS